MQPKDTDVLRRVRLTALSGDDAVKPRPTVPKKSIELQEKIEQC